MPIAAERLAELARIVGPDRLALDPGELAVYESDAFTLVRARPDAVVYPADTAETAAVVAAAARLGLAIVPRGAGTSLAGGTIAVEGGLCVCLSRMRRILRLDVRNRLAHVEAGVVNLAVTRAVQDRGWHYAPDPSSQSVCTLGGNVATNAGGPHTLKYGVTAQHVLGATVVMADGEIVQLGGDYEDAPGADLLGLVIGSEGTLALVTEVVVRLTRRPAAVRTLLVVFDSIDRATETIAAVIAAGILPAALELMDDVTVAAVEQWLHLGFPAGTGAVLLIELDGLEPGLERRVDCVRGICRSRRADEIRTARTEAERAELWTARKKSFGALGRYGLSYCTQDGVVPPSAVPAIMRYVAEVGRRYGLRIANVIHAGDGNIHPVLMYDADDAAQVRAVVAAGYEILDRCVALGGTVTGEHGIGIEKVGHLERMLDAPSRAAQQAVRDAFDPQRRLNPRKVLPTGGACLEMLRPPPGIAS